MEDAITREALEALWFTRESVHYFTKRGTAVTVSFPYGTRETVVRHGNKRRLDVRTMTQLRELLAEVKAKQSGQQAGE